MPQLMGSVGRGGMNRREDVLLVQQLINKNLPTPLAPLDEDGKCGSNTINAIGEYQRRSLGMNPPDYRVDPNGATFRSLTGASASPMCVSTDYLVRYGDTLSSIAQLKCGSSRQWPEIAKLNQIGPPYRILVGQKLLVPGGTQSAAGVPLDAGAGPSPPAQSSNGSSDQQPPEAVGLYPAVTVEPPEMQLQKSEWKIGPIAMPCGEVTVTLEWELTAKGEHYTLPLKLNMEGTVEWAQKYATTLKDFCVASSVEVNPVTREVTVKAGLESQIGPYKASVEISPLPPKVTYSVSSEVEFDYGGIKFKGEMKLKVEIEAQSPPDSTVLIPLEDVEAPGLTVTLAMFARVVVLIPLEVEVARIKAITYTSPTSQGVVPGVLTIGFWAVVGTTVWNFFAQGGVLVLAP